MGSMTNLTNRRDIQIRDRIILKLYIRGISRKQIPYHIDWSPRMSYDAVKKVIQKLAQDGIIDRRRKPRK